MPRNFTENFYGPEGTQRALAAPRGFPEQGTTQQGTPGGPGAPSWGVPPSVAPRATSLLYKYPKNTRTLKASTKYSSSRGRVQNHQIQSRHHHGGFTTSIRASPMMREQFFVDLRVRSQQLDGFLSLAKFSIQWSLRDPYDVTLFAVCLLGSNEL